MFKDKGSLFNTAVVLAVFLLIVLIISQVSCKNENGYGNNTNIKPRYTTKTETPSKNTLTKTTPKKTKK